MTEGADEPSESRGESEDAERQDDLREEREKAKAELDALVEALRLSATPTRGRRASPLAVELSALPRTNDYLERLDREQDIKLKRRYARVLLWLLAGQLAVADGVFIAYAQVGAHWRLSATVIDVWLGATLIEVVGIVLVVTRYLFPRRDTQP
jgi:hypothetical protein